MDEAVKKILLWAGKLKSPRRASRFLYFGSKISDDADLTRRDQRYQTSVTIYCPDTASEVGLWKMAKLVVDPAN